MVSLADPKSSLIFMFTVSFQGWCCCCIRIAKTIGIFLNNHKEGISKDKQQSSKVRHLLYWPCQKQQNLISILVPSLKRPNIRGCSKSNICSKAPHANTKLWCRTLGLNADYIMSGHDMTNPTQTSTMEIIFVKYRVWK